MKIVFDFQAIYDRLAVLSISIDYFSLFFVVFIALSCFSAVNLALKLLAGKRIKFSFLMLLLFLLCGAAMFCLAYIEYVESAKAFDSLYRVGTYAAGEFVAITVLYAVFFGFAHKDATHTDLKKETATCLAKVVKSGNDDAGRVYKVATEKYDFNAGGRQDYPIDFGGVYDFIYSVRQLGADKEKLDALERKIRFYDGLPVNKGTLPMINNLFSGLVRLAREK